MYRISILQPLQRITFCLLLGLSLLLSACGGGNSSSPAATNPADKVSVGGVTAVGAPIVGANVVIKDKNGKAVSTSSDSKGVYSADVSGLTPPFVLQVSGGTVNGVANQQVLHSVSASGKGTVNVTTLTELLTARLSKAKSADYFAQIGQTGGSNLLLITEVNTAAAQGGVIDFLKTVMPGVDLSVLGNFITASFAADSVTAYDKALDALKKAQDNNQVDLNTLANHLSSGAPFNQFSASLVAGTSISFCGAAVSGKSIDCAGYTGGLRWTSSDPTVATVIGIGTANGVAPGKALLRLVNGDNTILEVDLTVTAVPTVPPSTVSGNVLDGFAGSYPVNCKFSTIPGISGDTMLVIRNDGTVTLGSQSFSIKDHFSATYAPTMALPPGIHALGMDQYAEFRATFNVDLTLNFVELYADAASSVTCNPVGSVKPTTPFDPAAYLGHFAGTAQFECSDPTNFMLPPQAATLTIKSDGTMKMDGYLGSFDFNRPQAAELTVTPGAAGVTIRGNVRTTSSPSRDVTATFGFSVADMLTNLNVSVKDTAGAVQFDRSCRLPT